MYYRFLCTSRKSVGSFLQIHIFSSRVDSTGGSYERRWRAAGQEAKFAAAWLCLGPAVSSWVPLLGGMSWWSPGWPWPDRLAELLCSVKGWGGKLYSFLVTNSLCKIITWDMMLIWIHSTYVLWTYLHKPCFLCGVSGEAELVKSWGREAWEGTV